MLDFASPHWLWAALAVLLPLALHLLSQGRRRRIRVGSVKLLRDAKSRRFRRFRLDDVPLLALRGALLASLALLLARPQGMLSAALAGSKARGWILAEPELLARRQALERDWPQVYSELDRLVAEGHPLYLLRPGFPAASAGTTFSETRPDASDSEAGASGERVSGRVPTRSVGDGRERRERNAAQERLGLAPSRPRSGSIPDVWSYLREADTFLPEGSTLWVFTFDRLAALRGTRPALHCEVRWAAVGSPEERRWLERAPTPAPSGPAPDVSLPVTVAHSARRAEDALLVRSALDAAARFAGVSLRLESRPAEAWTPGPDDGLVFWLAETPAPEALEQQVARGLVLVRDAGSERLEEDRSWIVLDRLVPAAAPRVFRRSADEAPGVTLWRDGFGRPLLEARIRGAGVEYVVHGRFDAESSELVLHPAFPEGLVGLLKGWAEPEAPFAEEERGVSPSQRQPQKRAWRASGARLPVPSRSEAPLGFLVLGLFAAERWASIRRMS
jgi:aerotolerance regulator-like protein